MVASTIVPATRRCIHAQPEKLVAMLTKQLHDQPSLSQLLAEQRITLVPIVESET